MNRKNKIHSYYTTGGERMSLKIHASSKKKEDIAEFLRINKPIVRAGAKLKTKEDEDGFYHVYLRTAE